MLSTIERPVEAALAGALAEPRESQADIESSKSASRKEFHIFGKGISFSISPTIHNAGFSHDGLPCSYDIRESDEMVGVADLIGSSSFGGASVTMPHKLQAFRYCDEVTETARLIGAINTLVVSTDSGKRRITGENTDWSGLYSILTSHTRRSGKNIGSSMVIGAGGASRAALYALWRAGSPRIFLSNRTLSKAEEVRDSFKGVFDITIVSDYSDMAEKPDVIIGTVPADSTTEDQFRGLLGKEGLCIDMSYKPRLTPLLKVARSIDGWETVTGVEVLLAQAFDQYRLWTGNEPPRREMVWAVACKEQDFGLMEMKRLFT